MSDEPDAYQTCLLRLPASLRYGTPVHAPWAQAEWRARCKGKWQ